jgi:hypothetical protein
MNRYLHRCAPGPLTDTRFAAARPPTPSQARASLAFPRKGHRTTFTLPPLPGYGEAGAAAGSSPAAAPPATNAASRSDDGSAASSTNDGDGDGGEGPLVPAWRLRESRSVTAVQGVAGISEDKELWASLPLRCGCMQAALDLWLALFSSDGALDSECSAAT